MNHFESVTRAEYGPPKAESRVTATGKSFFRTVYSARSHTTGLADPPNEEMGSEQRYEGKVGLSAPASMTCSSESTGWPAGAGRWAKCGWSITGIT
jgi:hypothetical protein